MQEFRVTNTERITVNRSETIDINEAIIIAKVMSRSSEDRSSEIYFVENDMNGIHFMFYNGIMFTPDFQE